MKKWFLAFSFLFTFVAQAAVQINGAGATFPYPLYSDWFHRYNKKDAQVQLNYQSIGSGGGIAQLIAGTVDFGASDVPMSKDEQGRVPKAKEVMQIPMTLGAVAVVYNQPALKAPLKLSGEILSKIYMGQITKWSDPLIQKENPGVTLPTENILVVYRSDGSGTTAVFTDYLSQVGNDWKNSVGNGKSVKFPTGAGGKGNEGVTNYVKQTKGSIGYVELNYALENKLSTVSLKNKDGKYVVPTMAAVTAAAKQLTLENYLVSFVNAPGETSYPISSLSYLLIPVGKFEGEKKKKMQEYLNWALTEGQKVAPNLNYAPLPQELVKPFLGKLKDI